MDEEKSTKSKAQRGNFERASGTHGVLSFEPHLAGRETKGREREE